MEFEAILVELGCEVAGPYGRFALAFEAARTMSLDGAVLDANLAGERSFSLAEQLQGRGVPFFFVTGLSRVIFPDSFTDCYVLTKPVRQADFAKLVRQLFLADHSTISARNSHS